MERNKKYEQHIICRVHCAPENRQRVQDLWNWLDLPERNQVAYTMMCIRSRQIPIPFTFWMAGSIRMLLKHTPNTRMYPRS